MNRYVVLPEMAAGHFLRVLAASRLGLKPAAGRFFLLATASVSVLRYENSRSQPVVRLWNDTHHVGDGIDLEITQKLIMKVLVIDIGGTHVKVLATGQKLHREFASGPALIPKRMVAEVRKLVPNWKYDVVSIGYPGPVLRDRPVSEPWNLGKGWVGFNFQAAFKCPVRIMNDAAMQALGSYKRGKMLFLGLGTGLGSALIVDGIVEPMELGHLPYKKATFEDYVGVRGLEKHGKKKWRSYVADVVKRLVAAIEPDEVVLGGGNVKKLKELPAGCRVGDNANAFVGGFRVWEKAGAGKGFARARPRLHKRKPTQLTKRNKTKTAGTRHFALR